MTTVAFVDARAGCAGDMFLGALVDAGLPARGPDGRRACARARRTSRSRAEAVERGPLAATKVHVLHPRRDRDARRAPGAAADATHGHRTLAAILALVEGATALPAEARGDAVRVFRCLAEAEARVHGRSVDEVHFHEVGAADALVDVVGTCVGLRHLGVARGACRTAALVHGRDR